ncbi:UDP-glucuronosyltransferase 1-8 [Eumeta japonica]|uniref:UDP-glucuronosyltransferase 1-8 n=1 Tax=Eumeta variegata TaxID=151549 RepID=A0A4C1VTZ5_EUMVA|nr:UDP-glucuronosyltransferase 1-8 [Eumeta japonica]
MCVYFYSYRERVKYLSLVYHDRPVHPAKELVHWVEHAVKTRGAPHLRSRALTTPWYQKIKLVLLKITFSLRPSIETIIERQKRSPIDDTLERHFSPSGRYIKRKTSWPFCRLEGISAVLAYLKAINKEDLYDTYASAGDLADCVDAQSAIERVN